MNETAQVTEPPAAKYESARIVTIAQIVDGSAACYCGADAVLVVDTEPDADPGPVCYQHAIEYIDVTVSFVRQLFRPKEAQA